MLSLSQLCLHLHLLLQSCIQVGPSSVANELETKALCFGGSHCTATDIAIASGIAPVSICGSEEGRVRVGGLGAAMVYAAIREMRRKLETVIDSVKVYSVECQIITAQNFNGWGLREHLAK